MLLPLFTWVLVLCISTLTESRYGCPSAIQGCSCQLGWVDINFSYKVLVICNGIRGNVNDFKSSLQSLQNYEIDELIITNYLIQELPEEPFTNTVIKRVTIMNSPTLQYLGGRETSTKTFFDNLGNSLESIVMTNVPTIQQSEWAKISSALANQVVSTASTPSSGTEPSEDGSDPTGGSSGTGSDSTSQSTSEDTEPTVVVDPTETPAEGSSSSPSSSSSGSPTTTEETTTTERETTTASTNTSDSSGFNLRMGRKMTFLKDSVYMSRSLKSIDSYAKERISDGPVLKNLIMFRNTETTVQSLNDFEPLAGVERVIMRSIGLTNITSDLTGFGNIRLLDLSENRLTTLNARLPATLTTIYLFSNQIITFDKQFFTYLDNVRLIDVRDNPLSCACNDIQDIVNNQRLQGVFVGTCATPAAMRGKRFGTDGCV